MIQVRCDFCGKESDWTKQQYLLTDWNQASIKVNFHHTKRFDLCPDCSEKLGWTEARRKEYKAADQIDELFEALRERLDIPDNTR